ncbi:MAG TPA: MBL fold metallo-hydrolase [Thermohalobaculum sp.]|nr:MBL fold metallo-hydrolase [Thermohalobaculum sp.]
MTLTVTFVGTGDAFGTGGRMNTCILVDAPGIRFAIDFGATSVNALKGLGIEHDSIDAILLTHLHGDHAAGIPVLLMDAMLGTKRQRPLTIAGPPGTAARLPVIFGALFPGSEAMQPKFPLDVVEIAMQRPLDLLGLRITTWPAIHTPQTVPTSMRVEVAGKVIAYTGDTAWNEHLPALARGSDLLIAECYFHTKPVPFHLNYPAIREHRDELQTRRLILTHMGPEMLAAAESVPEECAHDGMVVTL